MTLDQIKAWSQDLTLLRDISTHTTKYPKEQLMLILRLDPNNHCYDYNRLTKKVLLAMIGQMFERYTRQIPTTQCDTLSHANIHDVVQMVETDTDPSCIKCQHNLCLTPTDVDFLKEITDINTVWGYEVLGAPPNHPEDAEFVHHNRFHMAASADLRAHMISLVAPIYHVSDVAGGDPRTYIYPIHRATKPFTLTNEPDSLVLMEYLAQRDQTNRLIYNRIAELAMKPLIGCSLALASVVIQARYLFMAISAFVTNTPVSSALHDTYKKMADLTESL